MLKHTARVAFLCMSGLIAATLVQAAPTADQIIGWDLRELRLALDRGDVKSVDVVSAYLERIQRDNRNGKAINAVTALNEKALEQARAWDDARARSSEQKISALGGIPFLAKDNYDTAGIATTGGSIALAASVPSANAFIVQKLLDNGAILLGKTNMSELAASYGWLGYSSMGGQTLNPTNPLRDASGSSSGSAAAVAANFAPFALGTDTVGSIRSPASVTGTVGLRPTLGLTSRSGVIPLSLTADVTGAITRTVRDQALVLDVIQGIDKNDAATLRTKHPQQSYATGLDGSTLKDKIIAVVDNFDGGNPDVDRVKKDAVSAMRHAGAKIVHLTLPKVFEDLTKTVLGPVGVAEFRPQFEAYLGTLEEGQPRTMEEFMKRLDVLTENGRQKINPGRYKGLLENYRTKKTDSPEYIDILTNVIPRLRADLTSLIVEGQHDALFMPTMSCPATVVQGKKDPSFVCTSASPYAATKIAAALGFPEISVKAGMAAGNVPVGVSFLGKAGDDRQLLELAAAFERLSLSNANE